MLLTAEATQTLKSQVGRTLLEGGFTPAKIYKKNDTSGRRWVECYGGFTYEFIQGTIWHDGSITQSKLRIRRWANGECWGSKVRELSTDAYKASLDAAGFITEVKGKALFVLGKEGADA